MYSYQKLSELLTFSQIAAGLLKLKEEAALVFVSYAQTERLKILQEGQQKTGWLHDSLNNKSFLNRVAVPKKKKLSK